MIIIPDVHGRAFWKEAVKDRENEKIIFLGDYMDPYPDEDEFNGMGYDEIFNKAFENFKQILEFKKAHADNVILLIGNHDAHYFMCTDKGSRYDRFHAKEIKKTFDDNVELFKLIDVEKIGEKTFVFTHAGVHKLWLYDVYGKEEIDAIPVEDTFAHATTIADMLNSDIGVYGVEQALGDMSYFRGGYEGYGSIVWADIREYDLVKKPFVGDVQVFGHTQLSEPIVTHYRACLDCRRGFLIDNTGVICELNGIPVEIKEANKK